jgi:hypothetical protein
MPTSASLPASTRRLFAHYAVAEIEAAASLSFAIGRLLEEGDCTDLAWLLQQVNEQGLAEWVEQRGNRQLSRRSRVFWRLVLRLGKSDEAEPRGDLWPLR